MDISKKLVRQNKKIVGKDDSNKIIKQRTISTDTRPKAYIPMPKTSNYDKILKLLSDKTPHSMNDIMISTRIASMGNIHNLMKILIVDDMVETTTCDHCDSNQKLYRLK